MTQQKFEMSKETKQVETTTAGITLISFLTFGYCCLAPGFFSSYARAIEDTGHWALGNERFGLSR